MNTSAAVVSMDAERCRLDPELNLLITAELSQQTSEYCEHVGLTGSLMKLSEARGAAVVKKCVCFL